jgi:hypothetical protein
MCAMLIVPAGGPDLEGVLSAQLRLERSRAVRELLVWLLVLDGGLAWCHGMWPRRLPAGPWDLAAASWPLFALAFVALLVFEARAKARLARLLPPDYRSPKPLDDG